MRSSLPLLAILFAASYAPPALAEERAPRKALQSEYTDYDKAVKQGMPGMQKWCEENLAPDYAIIFLDGNTLNRQQYLDMIQRLIASPAPAWKDVKSQKSQIKELKVQGDDVVATVEIETTYATNNPKRKQITLERPYRETWVKVGDTWKVKKSEELEVKVVAAANPRPGRTQQSNFPRQRGGFPGGSYPGGSYPGGSYPGGSYPGGGYPVGRPGYPGG